MQDGIFRKELCIFGRVWEAHLLVISGDRGWLSSLANPGASGAAGGYSLGQTRTTKASFLLKVITKYF